MKKSSQPTPAAGLTLTDKLQRGDLLSAGCPSRVVLKHITSRWGVLALMVLDGETRRFSELRRLIDGVSERMLAQTLQWLEADGLVKRVAYDVVPPHVEYSLTPLGQQAAQKVRALADWVEVSFPDVLQHWNKTTGVPQPAEADSEAG
ncbi:winged helix-turn-helix transcriptional regulator [Hymenobacter cellulosilyticus]|uniref:Helix-turn-helix transcriptional regulator n=1 Tax=Hymenobacter cellulosilyticus TaxID=2932248 RepID=A0A8T9Q8X3_9BACT|nr:helix-turn-helix domain-containing protein [Hymenobacter cellulosilyticus]UOQ72558.1 helix-turn-helix transcriptional regulator [Hymenobacter cellulosilyticus]